MNSALLVIDIQNDYFPEGLFPLWNTENTLTNINTAISKAAEQNIEVIYVQHIANPEQGKAPFFNADTNGVEFHNGLHQAQANGHYIVKSYADSFEQTPLNDLLQSKDIDTLYICGMMTQNCVTHTALSKSAEQYNVFILHDCCTTVDEMIHKIALNGVSIRVPLIAVSQM
ncbi:cysteine hydrolase family protein [Pseudoalteromonas piscicida]|uniref:Cysteine hydrolase n=1 Tax=Pseudoalteromonas piscicida TaxID=43662 RepID=A0A2A5JNW1_PSEO7|nr:cysteine hydrolase family protein [Pseudoalteromonas piscicida]PCK31108.1 cysteine hydrolase [Pseudoalteromonas piscicida]